MKMKRIPALLVTLSLLLTAAPARCEEVFTLEDVSGSYTTDRDYLRIACPIEGEQQVTVTVADDSGSVVYQRDYGLCSGLFRSEDIYLRLQGSQTLYSITVDAGGQVSACSINRTMPRLTGNAACSVGYPLSALSGSGSWKTATLLDLEQLEGDSLTVPMYASGAYELGTVTFTVQGGALTVTAAIAPGVDGTIDSAAVYVATDALDAQNLGTRSFSGPEGQLNSAISLNGARYAAVYVKLTVSFDPLGVPGSPATILDGQEELWRRMQQEITLNAVG
ncbi:MAG: hypothetical protein ACI4O7_12925 [Aristaeellaceae bacterium]